MNADLKLTGTVGLMALLVGGGGAAMALMLTQAPDSREQSDTAFDLPITSLNDSFDDTDASDLPTLFSDGFPSPLLSGSGDASLFSEVASIASGIPSVAAVPASSSPTASSGAQAEASHVSGSAKDDVTPITKTLGEVSDAAGTLAGLGLGLGISPPSSSAGQIVLGTLESEETSKPSDKEIKALKEKMWSEPKQSLDVGTAFGWVDVMGSGLGLVKAPNMSGVKVTAGNNKVSEASSKASTSKSTTSLKEKAKPGSSWQSSGWTMFRSGNPFSFIF